MSQRNTKAYRQRTLVKIKDKNTKIYNSTCNNTMTGCVSTVPRQIDIKSNNQILYTF